MKRFPLAHTLLAAAAAAACLIASGCSSSTLVTSPPQNGGLSFDSFNERVRDDEVTISFLDGSRAYGRNFRIGGDSAYWTEVQSGSAFQSPLAAVQTISISPNRFVGGWIGFGAGFTIGGVAGLAIGNANAPQGEDHNLKEALGFLVGAGAGGLLGAAVGAIIAPPTEYHFSNPPSK